MKKLFLSALMLIGMLSVCNAQSLKKTVGDMNGDGKIDVSDVTALVSVILGNQSIEYITPSDFGLEYYEYIDLGLSSGTLWASCNVGASLPEEYGEYFAWGEWETKATELYSWPAYQYAIDDYNQLTKYCMEVYGGTYGYNNFVDNLHELEAIDDAAFMNWGPAWRMPTAGQWQELIDECDWEWAPLNNINGYFVKSKTNNNAIFLPAAGTKSVGQGGLSQVGNWGFYWSSSLYWNAKSGNPSNALSLSFYQNSVSENMSNAWNGRFIGMSIRPVRY
ncbi:MAG: hypothetical protein IK000_08780 [Bacteroidaceae bacterium]|nr:hypothetical protein [Bacteroidaceae bacterium]